MVSEIPGGWRVERFWIGIHSKGNSCFLRNLYGKAFEVFLSVSDCIGMTANW